MESKYKDRLSEFKDIETKIIFWSIYDTKHNDILLTYDFIRIKNFEKKKLTHVEENSCRIYETADKKTWSNYIAKRIKEPLNKFYCFEKEIFYKEVNFILDLRHPSILKFIGNSPIYFKIKPILVIVSKHGSNGTLGRILLDLDMKNTNDQNDSLLFVELHQAFHICIQFTLFISA